MESFMNDTTFMLCCSTKFTVVHYNFLVVGYHTYVNILDIKWFYPIYLDGVIVITVDLGSSCNKNVTGSAKTGLIAQDGKFVFSHKHKAL